LPAGFAEGHLRSRLNKLPLSMTFQLVKQKTVNNCTGLKLGF